MNNKTCQITDDAREMVCQVHNHEIVAIDLVSPENKQSQYLCLNCLVEKMNNNNISTKEQTQKRIKEYKEKKQKKRMDDIKIRLINLKTLVDQITALKINVDKTLDNLSSKIETKMKITQQGIQSSQENCQIQSNFQEEVKQLSEFLSSQQNQMDFDDIKDIEDIQKQFEKDFHNDAYIKTVQTFKNVIENLKVVNQDNKIELIPLQIQNNQKPQTLSRLCQAHKKETIMIDLDSKNKNIEDRFACAQCVSDRLKCISDPPEYQYRTIEEVNQMWNEKMVEQDRIVNSLKSNRQKKKDKLNKKIDKMRKNYIESLDNISDTLRTTFLSSTNQTKEINKFKQDSIQQLSQNELFSNIQSLIKSDQKQQDQKIDSMISKDYKNSKEVAEILEKLKLTDQLNIQKSINILKDQSNNNKIQGISKSLQQIQETTILNQEKLITNNEINEFISSSKQIYCQMELFNQTIRLFEEHLLKFQTINNKVKSIQDHENYTTLEKQLHDYKEKFQKDFQNIQKYLEILSLRDKVGLNIKPKLFKDEYWIKLFFNIQEKSKKTLQESQLIYYGTKDELNGNSFWNKCNGKSNLLMIFKSESGNIFGGYSPCQWLQNKNAYVQDDTLSSFVFSQTHDQIYPLKQDKKQHAIYCNSGYGPSFGGGHDIYIKHDFFQDGYSNLGHSYQWDKYENKYSTHLFGQDKPNIIECEIFELKFI